MASNEVNTENSNAGGSEDIYADTNPVLNSLVLLVKIEHVDGRPIEPDILTEAAFKDVAHPKCIILFADVTSLNDAVTSYVMSQHPVCIDHMTFYYKRSINARMRGSDWGF